MRSVPSFWRGKACGAALVILLMMAFLSLYKSNLCPTTLTGDTAYEPAAAPEVAVDEPPPTPPPPPSDVETEMQRALTEQTRILEEIAKDVDSVNQSLDEITVLLQEPAR